MLGEEKLGLYSCKVTPNTDKDGSVVGSFLKMDLEGHWISLCLMGITLNQCLSAFLFY